MEQAAFSFVTIYLTVYDHLSSWWYGRCSAETA
jgi:hypothetical protein